MRKRPNSEQNLEEWLAFFTRIYMILSVHAIFAFSPLLSADNDDVLRCYLSRPNNIFDLHISSWVIF